MDSRASQICSRCGAFLDTGLRSSSGQDNDRCQSCGLELTTLAPLESAESLPSGSEERESQRSALANRLERDRRKVVSRARFAVYGLDDTWTGRRWIGGWNTSPEELLELELAHGNAYDPGSPLVRVGTSPMGHGTGTLPSPHAAQAQALLLGTVAKELAQRILHEASEHSASIQSTFTLDDPVGAWDSLGVWVDGRRVKFRLDIQRALVGGGRPHRSRRRGCNRSQHSVGRGSSGHDQDVEPYLQDDGLPL